jgi:hypothetical protein
MRFPNSVFLSVFLLSLFVFGFSSCELCPGERPVITFVNNGYCNCDVQVTNNDTRYVLGGNSVEVTLFPGSYVFIANCNSSAYLNNEMTLIEQIGCDLTSGWTTTIDLGCGDEFTYEVN